MPEKIPFAYFAPSRDQVLVLAAVEQLPVCFPGKWAHLRAGGEMENLERVKELARDLRKEEPRPAHEELGGESHAARCLDKCRATLVGWNGEFQFGCPMDQHFFQETGISSREFRDYVATGATDDEVGRWIEEHTRTQRK